MGTKPVAGFKYIYFIIRAKGDMQVRIMGGPKIAPLCSSLATHPRLAGRADRWMVSLLTTSFYK